MRFGSGEAAEAPVKAAMLADGEQTNKLCGHANPEGDLGNMGNQENKFGTLLRTVALSGGPDE